MVSVGAISKSSVPKDSAPPSPSTAPPRKSPPASAPEISTSPLLTPPTKPSPTSSSRVDADAGGPILVRVLCGQGGIRRLNPAPLLSCRILHEPTQPPNLAHLRGSHQFRRA